MSQSREEFAREMADTLDAALAEKGWSRFQLGNEIGISHAQISTTLSGKDRLSLRMAVGLARVSLPGRGLWMQQAAVEFEREAERQLEEQPDA